ncbi:MAG: orotate phosphoribosyltransferase [Gammaproteobacteria bacterium]
MPDKLRKLIEDKCLITDANITLSFGEKSSFYFDCKKITLDGEGLNLIADAVLDKINELQTCPQAIGGLTMGADFIVAAVTQSAYASNRSPSLGSIVRKEPKKHGTRNYIENQLPEGTTIVVVDDVITSGGSTRQACENFLASGYKIIGIIALVDREQGGAESLQKQFGVPVLSIFKRSDFPKLCGTSENRSAIGVC